MKQIPYMIFMMIFLGSCIGSGQKEDLEFEVIDLSSTAQGSLQSYESTLFPILRQNCAGCHGSTQAPTFAVSDSTKSHQILMDFFLVDLQAPNTSRLVKKILGGHQTFGPQLATQIENAIITWANTAPFDPGAGESNDPQIQDDPNKSNSVKIFETTVFPILKTNCTSCHGSFQNPLFALPDSTLAHNNLIDFGLIDFSAPANSRVVKKIQGGHQSFTSNLAINLENAITSWKEQLGNSELPTPPKLVATFSSIHKLVLVPKCLSCHSPGGQRSKEDYSDYNTSINTGKIKAGDPQDSEMYKECVDGEMPMKADPLTTEELDIIRDWILAGAKNN